jgi:hypothetical protein
MSTPIASLTPLVLPSGGVTPFGERPYRIAAALAALLMLLTAAF